MDQSVPITPLHMPLAKSRTQAQTAHIYPLFVGFSKASLFFHALFPSSAPILVVMHLIPHKGGNRGTSGSRIADRCLTTISSMRPVFSSKAMWCKVSDSRAAVLLWCLESRSTSLISLPCVCVLVFTHKKES